MKIESKTNPELIIFSRKSRYHEEMELQNFINLLDLFSLAQFLDDTVMYCHHTDCAYYDFKPLPPWLEDSVKQQVDDVAAITLRQFQDSYGGTGHGVLMED